VGSSNSSGLSGCSSTHLLSLESSGLSLLYFHGVDDISLLVSNLVLAIRLIQDPLDFSFSVSILHGFLHMLSSSASCFSDDNRLRYFASSDHSLFNYTLLVSSLDNLMCLVGLSYYLLDVLGVEDPLDLLLSMS